MEDKPIWEMEFARDQEQAETAVTGMAQMTALFFSQLIKSGLTREEALFLTGTWLELGLMGGSADAA